MQATNEVSVHRFCKVLMGPLEILPEHSTPVRSAGTSSAEFGPSWYSDLNDMVHGVIFASEYRDLDKTLDVLLLSLLIWWKTLRQTDVVIAQLVKSMLIRF